jgi:quinohemoprotein ethanol dehydrogenase
MNRSLVAIAFLVVLTAGVLLAKRYTSARSTASTKLSGNVNEWRLLGGNPEMQHHSVLKQINRNNVKSLGLAWYVDVPTEDGLAGNPLIADGVVYESGTLGKVWAHDVRNGKQLWAFDAHVKFDENGSLASFWGSRVNRGLALLDDKLFIGTGDCRLVAINRRTGTLDWQTQACNPHDFYTITGAPRVGNGKVYIGNANADSGLNRGYISAFDEKTGTELWRFYTVPGDPAKGFENKAMEMASKTWGKDYWKVSGGGSVWDAITFDPVLNQVYFGTDGPSPWNPNDRAQQGRGDELFTTSIIAVNADTGEYRWHYQTTPNDAWNYDATMHIMVAELPINGQKRRVVMEAPKNGFFYVLDAKTGKFISAKNIVRVNWASHIDEQTGRPVEIAEARYYATAGKRALVAPSPVGAHSFQAMSYDPATGLVYIPAEDSPTIVEVTNIGGVIGGSLHVDWSWAMRNPKFKGRMGMLIAWDPVQQKARWTANMARPHNGGMLSTDGGLVFAGQATGEFAAYRTDTGEKLWSFNTGSGIQAAPSTVEVDGEQLLILPVGASTALLKLFPWETYTDKSRGPSRLLALKLGGKTALPLDSSREIFPQPPRPRPKSEALVKRGAALFESSGCDLCHGSEVSTSLGSVADLRKASALTHNHFAEILAGSRLSGGMPSYTGGQGWFKVSEQDVQAIQAYVLNQAWDAYEAQQRKASPHN